MAHLHVSTAARSTKVGEPTTASRTERDSTRINDLWISDLPNDLACFGLCSPAQEDDERVDELGRLSLSSDVTPEGGMVARTWHDELGL